MSIRLSTTKWLGVALVVLVIVVAVLFFVLRLIQQNATDLETVVQTLASERAVIQQQQSLEEILEATSETRQELQTYIITGENGTVAFLSLVDSMANELGITLTTSQLEVISDPNATYDTLDVVFNIEGTEAAIMQSIKLFESLPYSGSVNQVTLFRSQDVATGRTMMTGSVSLAVSITKS